MNRRALPVLLAVVLIALVLSTLLTGQAIYLVPAAILLLVIGAMALAQWSLKRRLEHRHGEDIEDAVQADSEDPVPSAHLAKDERTPLGDTQEAHDEINPHDLPKGHPGRAEAEHEAAQAERFERPEEGVTRGNR